MLYRRSNFTLICIIYIKHVQIILLANADYFENWGFFKRKAAHEIIYTYIIFIHTYILKPLHYYSYGNIII